MGEESGATEKGRMRRQMLYDANHDPQLCRERAAAKDLCRAFNQLRPSDEAHQQELMRKLLGQAKPVNPPQGKRLLRPAAVIDLPDSL